MSEDMAHLLALWLRCHHPGTEALWGALSEACRGHGATLTHHSVSPRDRPAVVVRHRVSGTLGKELVYRTVILPGKGFIISNNKTFVLISTYCLLQ